jgi:hypothetical protein
LSDIDRLVDLAGVSSALAAPYVPLGHAVNLGRNV